MEQAMTYMDSIYDYKVNHNYDRGNLVCVQISDIHFGAMDPEYQYNILKEQFLGKIKDLNFDLISINGDLFHHKFMSNSDVIMYTSLFIRECIELCISKEATMIIIKGTDEHEAGQLKLFYHYLNTGVDLRIVENIGFEYVKGAKILCIPEKYDMGYEYYEKYLFRSGLYDMVLMHGMIKGAIYQDEYKDLDSDREPCFRIEDFVNCKGCIISGHVHTPGCFNGYFYYCGSPYRWQFGEEHKKGFLITLHDLNTGAHYVHFEEIISMKYNTININELITDDPNKLIHYVTELKDKENIDYLRLELTSIPTESASATLDIIKKYFRNNSTIKIKDTVKKDKFIKETNELNDEYEKYNYIYDSSLSEYEILSRYINEEKGFVFITPEEMIDIINEE